MSQENKNESSTRKTISRRDLLKSSVGLAGIGLAAPLLSACQGIPVQAPAQQQPAAAPAAEEKPAEAPAEVSSEPQKLTIWMAQSFTEAADKALQAIFVEWADQNGVELEYDISPSAQMVERVTPALEAGAPPDIMYLYESQTQFFRGQEVLLDVSDVVDQFRDTAGGLFDGPLTTHGWEGKMWSVPVQINPWVTHARQDLLDAAGLAYPKTWAELAETSAKIQNPPELYGFGPCLGLNEDANNNIIQMMWGFGGKMTNEDGSLDFKSDGTLAALNYVIDLYNQELIPPGCINWDNAGNNKAYQSRQVAFAINPASIYAWAVENDPELEQVTELYNAPAGPEGSFGMIDSWALGVFNATKSPELAKDALSYFLTPDNYSKFIEAAEGRAVPIYRGLMELPIWEKYPKYKNFGEMAETGRVLSWASAPTPAFGDVLEADLLAKMVHRVVLDGLDPEESMNEAYDAMLEIYQSYGMG